MVQFETKIVKTIERFQKRYTDEFNKTISSFISLGIENQCDLLLHDDNKSIGITIEDLCDEMLNSDKNRVSLLGGPGAGKSTLLLKLALIISSMTDNKIIPVLVKCGLENQSNIKNLVHVGGFSEEEKEKLWQEGRLFLIFDGINEVSNADIRGFLNSIML